MKKILKGKSLTLTFPKGMAEKYPDHGVSYQVGQEVPEELWHYVKIAGEGRYLEEVKEQIKEPAPKKQERPKKVKVPIEEHKNDSSEKDMSPDLIDVEEEEAKEE